jgi:isocitrate/isopropylmalate dehydrogenase
MTKQSTAPWMNPSYGFNLMWQTTQMALDAQAVIAMRLTKIARGGAAGQAEASLMVAEKIKAIGESQAIAFGALGSADGGAARITSLYQGKLAANRKRLSKG